MIRLAWKLALLAVLGVGLGATRAEACGDDPDCPMNAAQAEAKENGKAKAPEAGTKTEKKDGAKGEQKDTVKPTPTTKGAQGALERLPAGELLAGKCDCGSQADCTCKKGDCQCAKCGTKKPSLIEPLKGARDVLRIPRHARMDATSGMLI